MNQSEKIEKIRKAIEAKTGASCAVEIDMSYLKIYWHDKKYNIDKFEELTLDLLEMLPLSPVEEWIPVSTPPEIGEEVLVIIWMDGKYWDPFVCVYRGNGYWRLDSDGEGMSDYSERITHWMNIPPPPTIPLPNPPEIKP